ncbi:EamA family transporter [Brachybacterium endophyticum]|uniref:EamA family transporter n=1 Tax=Brachybacterium endophyticum TaxID=2182385 RepID=A0A2U2RK28_9MICO|nr:EamA family transporter [Brachybacterium endophyticum]PWH06232.1 EamA family transporter [Brachybacterium endophyticum]
MTGTALALVLGAAVLHALWNLAAKRASGDGYLFVWWYNVASAVLWLPIGLVVLARAGWPIGWELAVGPAVSAIFHIVYQLCLQTGYQRADLGVVYPVARGTGPLLTVVVALAVLGERPGWVAVGGGLVVIAGIVVVATGGSRALRHRASTGIWWGALTGAGIAAYTLWDDHAVTTWALAPVTYFSLGCTLQALAMTPGALLRSRAARAGGDQAPAAGSDVGPASALAVLRRSRLEIGIVAVLSPLAYVLVLEAMHTTPVALVAPARESSIVVGSLLAWWLFREPDPLRRLLGAVVVLGGIALIVA